MKKEEEKYCGECCWFYAEDTYGYGCCPFKFAEVRKCDESCEAGEHFISKQQMRHYMAVLLQDRRCQNDRSELTMYRPPKKDELEKAKDFAYKYMKIFSNL